MGYLKTSILRFFFFIISIVAIGSCIEEYWPELTGDYDNLLVIEGKITNEPGPYTIKLSRSSSLLEPDYNPLSGANITISDDQGNSETLSESSAGIYKTSETGMQGVIGRMYKLMIESNGKTYESEYEELLAPVGVESIIFKEEIHKVSETDEIYETGYQFYLTTETAINDKNYYYWEIEQTYEHHAPYPIEYVYNGSYEYFSESDQLWQPYQNDDPYELYYCWTTDLVKEVFTQSTEYLSQPKVNELALHFIPSEDERLRIQYSLQAKQYVVSEKAYTYTKSLEDMNSNNDNLYASIPYQIRGNLFNTENSEEAVLGYFLTAGISYSEHVFTPKNERPYKEAERWYMRNHEYELWAQLHCLVPYPDGFNKLPFYWEEIALSNPNDWPLYLTNVWSPANGVYVKLLVVIKKFGCIDCRINGGTTQKPDFWED